MTDPTASGQIYLQSYLAPLSAVLRRPDVTDVYVNRPGEVWIETVGGTIERAEVETLSSSVLERLSRQIAAHAHQGISREHPLLSASLPSGERIQIVLPPATRGHLAMAIRKHVAVGLKLDDYASNGGFEGLGSQTTETTELKNKLVGLLASGDFVALLSSAVRGRLNILVSGGTSTGKTTFLDALIREIEPSERLIVIEDAPELKLNHQNAVGLLSARSALSEAAVTTDDLLNAALRMRPDRIILGELRGAEAYAFLRAVNTGHPGSMTTVHANSPEHAIEQIALLVLQSGTALRREDIAHYIRSTVDVYVHLERTAKGRRITDVYLPDIGGTSRNRRT